MVLRKVTKSRRTKTGALEYYDVWEEMEEGKQYETISGGTAQVPKGSGAKAIGNVKSKLREIGDISSLKALEERQATEANAPVKQAASEALAQGKSINLDNIESTPIDIKQAALGGTKAAIPSIIKTAGTGAAIGAVGGSVVPGVGTGVGAVGGAIAGLIVGIYNGITSNLGSQASGNIAAQTKTLSDGKGNLKKLVVLAKNDPAHADKYVEAYYEQLGNIDKAYSQLKQDTDRNLYKFLSKDGTQQLQAFENFYSTGGLKDIYQIQMELAISGTQTDPSLEFSSMLDDLNLEQDTNGE